MGGQLNDLQKETARGAKSITPVDLNTGEIYDILRKRLFNRLPDPEGDEVDRVARAYSETYNEGVRGKALARSAEQLADEIVGSYPFHPGYKDILALFKENEKFRQTRGLIQFTANLLRGIWAANGEEIFLVGAQYLDFADQETRDQVKEIERTLESALANDVYDTDGSSHAQHIDAERNDRAASQVATLLFISSLSDNTDGIRGLPRETVIEYLVPRAGADPVHGGVRRAPGPVLVPAPPGGGPVVLLGHRERAQADRGQGDAKIPQDRVDDEMRRRLEEIFRPFKQAGLF